MPDDPISNKQDTASRTKPADQPPLIAAPELPYRPRNPKSYRPGIGLIGCGGISVEHLTAYRNAGYRVVALCDIDRDRAQERQQAFYPDAQIFTDADPLLALPDVEVVDITTHPPQRLPLIEAAIRAGKHVLSQKPFVTDLDAGRRLVRLADEHHVRLAVNQNARWAPHFSYLRHAVAAGLLGRVSSVQFAVHWDHNWVQGTPFDQVRHLILYDFAIHWFDMLTCLMQDRPPRRVYASLAHSGSQRAAPALLAQAQVEYDDAQAALFFNGDTRCGPLDSTFIAGEQGSIRSTGPDIRSQRVELSTADGIAHPQLAGRWFPDGFHGAMGELLVAIEEDREPAHSGSNNLASLALCFAAVESAERHRPVVPGSAAQLPVHAE